MKILDPMLVPDVSNWCDHINPKELQDAGCPSVIVGLYPATNKKDLHPISRKQAQAVANAGLILQAYYWDDIIESPVAQANWLADTIKLEGLPVKWIWADQEQWHTNWNLWYAARRGAITWDQVPRATPANISIHYQTFCYNLHQRTTSMGVYTNNGFVSSWSPPMNSWLPSYSAWVAQYGHQPKVATAMTWATLKSFWMPNYDIALAAGQLPSQVKGHQFTGDVCVLPGSYTIFGKALPMDVSVFSRAFLDQIGGSSVPVGSAPIEATPPSMPLSTDYMIKYPRVNIRLQNGTWVRYGVFNQIVKVAVPLSLVNGYTYLINGEMIWHDYIIFAK